MALQTVLLAFFLLICSSLRKCLNIQKGYSEAITRRREDNTMAQEKKTKVQFELSIDIERYLL